MALAATLIFSTFIMGYAFAVESGDVISFQSKTNKVVVDPASNYPPNARASTNIQLLVDEVSKFQYDGLGRITLEISFIMEEPIVISSDNSFSYTYDDVGNILTIHETQVQDDSGMTWLLSGVGFYNLDENDLSRAEITLNLGGQKGEEVFEISSLGRIGL